MNIHSSAKKPWVAPIPAEKRNYPMNCWWVAGFRDHITQEFTDLWLCDTPVLLYRKEDGSIVAIENRCAHRSAPLHMGRRRGDNVECPYHGFTYAPDGSCVRVPSMKAPPGTMCVKSFPVVESGPFVWIYLGDPARIDDVPPPHILEWFDENGVATVSGVLEVKANYMLLKENVLDLTHFGYVHASSFKITDWVDPPKTVIDGDTCGYHQSFVESPLPAVFAEPLGLPLGTPYNRDNYGSFVSPALQIAAVDFTEPQTGERTGRFRIAHATTPVSQTQMLYFWVLGRDFGTSDEQMQALKELTIVGFKEDEEIIEAVQAVQSRDPRPTESLEKSVKSDGPGVQARRIVQRWMERETG